jgi:DNA-binding CsgD family transcriptional regulator
MSNASNPSAPKPRLNAQELSARRDRIFARMLEGQSYQAIAGAEEITQRRVRKIVQDALAKENVNPKSDFILVQIARLEGALRLVEQKLAEGKLNAVDRLVKVLRELDRYHQASAIPASLARRDPWESAGMLARLDRIAASRAAVAQRFVEAAPVAENAMGMDSEAQVFDFARFADANEAPKRLESRA